MTRARRPAMIVDAHLDIAWNAVAQGLPFDRPTPGFVVSRPALAEAGVGLVFATLFCAPARAGKLAGRFTYRTPREANLMARAQLGWYGSAGPPLVRDRTELDRHRRGWRPGKLAAVLLMEGADPIRKPAEVGWWQERGVRIIGPAWSGTRYAGGTGEPGGLTGRGVKLLRAMARQQVILDLSHLADEALRDALQLWQGPLIASHSNAGAIVPGDRQLADSVAAEVGRRGGMLGVSFYRRHLRADERPARLEDVVRHLRHLARAAGGPEHVGLGSDLDGGFKASEAAIRREGQLSRLGQLLQRHFSARQVEGIMGTNWLEFLGRSLPAAAPEARAAK
ncbi:MAG: dipeptidase [Candidatus Dormibacter sp.]|uniref:dipeptidase n=1 Tax=Candidatus Dormibacter sp. TaxID=2973982 RepID=UPI000DB2E9FD|nr:MAG: peptidase M19 [Candidatus Dormibacteraeota bacterium]